MFALVRDLANGREVTEIPVSLWFVERHHLGPLAARAGLVAAKDELVHSTVAWARTERVLPPIVDRLVSAGVRVAPLKGVSYATSIYAIPAERPMSDIDLLVEPHDVAERVLAELGYTSTPSSPFHHATTWSLRDTWLDLHRGFVSAGRSTVELERVWERTSAGWPRGARRLERTDELIFHFVHMARGRLCGPLVQIVDAHRLLADGDGELFARADRWKLGKSVRIAHAYYRSIMDGHVVQPYATEEDLIYVRQPSFAKRVRFDLAVSESPRQLAARAVDWIAQRWFAGRPSGDARGR